MKENANAEAVYFYTTQLLGSSKSSGLSDLEESLVEECRADSAGSCLKLLCRLRERGLQVADEVLAGNCVWDKRKIKLGDLILPDGKSVAEVCEGTGALQVAGGAKVLAVREGDKYRVVSGIDAVKALVCERGAGMDTEIEAYVAECDGEPRAEDACSAPATEEQSVAVKQSWVNVYIKEPGELSNLQVDRYVKIVVESDNLGFIASLEEELMHKFESAQNTGIKVTRPKKKKTNSAGGIAVTYRLVIKIDIIERYSYYYENVRYIVDDLHDIFEKIERSIYSYSKKYRIEVIYLEELKSEDVKKSFAKKIRKILTDYYNYSNLLSA